MRLYATLKWIWLALSLCALALCVACEDRPSLTERYADNEDDGGATTTTSASARAKASASASVSASPRRPMPPRPVPLGSSGPIQPNAPQEEQLMAIHYCIAMASPHPSDPIYDEEVVKGIIKKLEPAVRAADRGKTPPKPVAMSGKRVLTIEMANGCTAKTPERLLHAGAGTPLRDAYAAGILVVKCHDNKWACHQSTRVPEDVLCHAAPRRQPL